MDDFISPQQLSKHLSLSCGTLANWRSRHIGPRFVKLGKVIRYRISDVLAWAEKRP